MMNGMDEIKYIQIYGILPNRKEISYMGRWQKDRLAIFKLLRENGWKYKHSCEYLYIYRILPNGELIGHHLLKKFGLAEIECLGNYNYTNKDHDKAFTALANKAKELKAQ